MKIPEGWEEIELGQVFNFEKKTGKPASAGSESGKYKFFTSSETQKLRIDGYDFEGPYLIFSTGGKAAVHYCNEKFSTSNDCFVVRIEDILVPKYVYYFLKANMHLLEEGFKGSGLKHISKGHIQKLCIVYPPNKSSQHKIVELLEKVELAKSLRIEANLLTTLFLGSQFLSLFGDPARNQKNWSTKTIREVSMKISDGPFGSNLKSEHYCDEGIRVIRLQNIGIDEWIDKDKAFISREHYQTISKHTCEPGDIVVATMGDPNLRATILPPTITIAVNKADCVQIRPNKSQILPEFLCALLNRPEIISKASSFMHGQTRTRINMSQVASLQIPVPPLNIQKSYATVVQAVKSLNLEQNKSLTSIDLLRSNLLQAAFRGELS